MQRAACNGDDCKNRKGIERGDRRGSIGSKTDQSERHKQQITDDIASGNRLGSGGTKTRTRRAHASAETADQKCGEERKRDECCNRPCRRDDEEQCHD
jgi:hypothetical protein